MEMKILWSDYALAKLEEIFEYYKTKASLRIARTLVKEIIRNTNILASNPLIGAKEPFLSNQPYEYRYLVYKNYKIIYYCIDNHIVISSVFDSRQNPIKKNRSTD